MSERPALLGVFVDGVLHKWDCAERGHVYEFQSAECLACGEVEQMTFEMVTELEEQAGDPEYTAWLAAGRPLLSGDEYDALRARRARRAPIDDVLPGL